jgi:hypothetical protein
MRKRKHNMIAALSWSTAAHDYLKFEKQFPSRIDVFWDSFK